MNLPKIICIMALLTSTKIFAADLPSIDYSLISYGKSTSDVSALLENISSQKISPETTIQKGLLYYRMSTLGENGFAKKAREIFESLLNENETKNSTLYALLGSSMTMQARDSSKVYEKISLVNKGMAILDEAVDMDPTNLLIRKIRMSVAYNLPSMFERKKTAVLDAKYIIEHKKNISNEEKNNIMSIIND